MGKLINISPDVLRVAQDGLDDLIDLFGKNCLIVYPEGQTSYINNQNPNPTQYSGNIFYSKFLDNWGNGQPSPTQYIWNEVEEIWESNTQFTLPDPNTRVIYERPSEIIKVLISWDQRDFYVRPAQNVTYPDGTIQVKGYLSDVEKFLRADFFLIQNDLSKKIRLKYSKKGDPVDPSNIIQNRYFIMNMMRTP